MELKEILELIGLLVSLVALLVAFLAYKTADRVGSLAIKLPFAFSELGPLFLYIRKRKPPSNDNEKIVQAEKDLEMIIKSEFAIRMIRFDKDMDAILALAEKQKKLKTSNHLTEATQNIAVIAGKIEKLFASVNKRLTDIYKNFT